MFWVGLISGAAIVGIIVALALYKFAKGVRW